jgi:hypothetical protein
MQWFTYTSTDQIFTHGRIGMSHTVDQTISTTGCAIGHLFANTIYLTMWQRKHSLTICGPKTFANGRAFTDEIYTGVVCRLDSSPTIMVALWSVLTSVHTDVSFKLQVCLLEAVHTSMLADVSQVKPASNNRVLLILFLCIFDKIVHIVPFLHRFFASYTKEEHVKSRQFLGYVIVFMK